VVELQATDWRERIATDRAIHHGEPCIKGTRVPVSVIVGSIAEGNTPERIIESWPQLTDDDITAALKFSAEAGTLTSSRQAHELGFRETKAHPKLIFGMTAALPMGVAQFRTNRAAEKKLLQEEI
jgi:uncharacterized protein (DUF433 family)